MSAIASVREFEESAPPDSSAYLSIAIRGFFENGGRTCSIAWIAATDPITSALDALSSEPVSILCCPDELEFARASSRDHRRQLRAWRGIGCVTSGDQRELPMPPEHLVCVIHALIEGLVLATNSDPGAVP